MYRLLIALLMTCFLVAGCGNGGEDKASVSQPGAAGPAPGDGIAWKTTWDDAAQAARNDGSHILLLFTNPERCPPCRMMEQQTWPNPEVVAHVNQHFVPLKVHTGRSEERSLGSEFEVRGIPTTVVCDTDKKVLAKKVGFAPPDAFLAFLQSASSLQRLQEAAETHPDDLDAILELAQAYHGLDRGSDAVPLLEKICTADPDNAEGKMVSALHLLGAVALAERDMDGAKEKFKRAAGLDPKRESEYADDNALQLALLPAHENDLASAASALEQFIQDFPESSLRPQAFLYLGQCYAGSDDREAARKALEKLLKEHSDAPEAEYAKQIIESM